MDSNMYIPEQFTDEGEGGRQVAEMRQTRRPRIVRQQGVQGLIEVAYSQLYRLILLVVPLREADGESGSCAGAPVHRRGAAGDVPRGTGHRSLVAGERAKSMAITVWTK